MIETQITKLLGIKYPIFQGGMAWISDASLAAGVSGAGGLGTIAAMNASADYLAEEVASVRGVTSNPFAVNVMLMSPNVEEIAQAVIDLKVPVVVTGAGNPSKYIAAWKEAGIIVIPVVPSVAMTKLVCRSGADAVIAEGTESGGHVGELTTMALVPQVVDVADTYDVPVVAAGGIADGRQVAAAFMLGAEGVQLGTRFLVADECTVHENYKQKIIAAKDIDTIVTGKFRGHAARSLKTAYSRDYFKMEHDMNVSDEELADMRHGSLASAAKNGDAERGCFLAGQIASMVTKTESAQSIIESLFADTERVLNSVR